MSHRLRTPLLIGAGALMLSWPAFYNGYPLLWFDSCGYLQTGWLTYVSEMRSPFYGISIAPLLALKSVWPVVLAQAVVSAAMIFLVLRAVCGEPRAVAYLLILALLALLTGLSWHNSLIMADIHASWLPLGMFLLLFARDRLAKWETAFVFAVTLAASMVHYSHLPLAIALAIAALAALIFERRTLRDIMVGIGCCLAIATITMVGHVAMQLRFHDRVELTSGSQVFLLARFVEDGVAKNYLEAHCPATPFALCAFVDRMPMSINEFLWWKTSPLKGLGGIEGVRDEAAAIVAGSLREQPLRIAWLSLGHTLDQLTRFSMDPYIQQFDSSDREWKNCAGRVRGLAPLDYASYVASRQSNDQVGLAPIFSLQLPFIVASAALLLVLFCASTVLRANPPYCELLWLVLLALLANAFICGGLSGPDDRYESRMIWLLPFLLFTAVMLVRGGRSSTPHAGAGEAASAG